MKPIYLNQRIRDAILENALKGSHLEKDRQKIIDAFKSLADQFYTFATGGEDLEKFEAANEGYTKRVGANRYVNNALPAMRRESHITISFRGQVLSIYFRGDTQNWSRFNLEDNVSRIGAASKVVLDETPSMCKLGELAFETEDAKTDFMVKHDALTAELRNVLDSVRTVKKLIELWPGVEKYLPEDLKTLSAPLPPAISIEKLEALLNGPND